VNPKAREIDSNTSMSILKCVTKDWKSELNQLIDTTCVSSKISLGNLKIQIKKLLK
jgi:hypothetical protein